MTPEPLMGLTVRFNDFGWDSPVFLANALTVILVLIFVIPVLFLICMKDKHYKNENKTEIIRRYWDQISVVICILVFTRLWFACVINFTAFTIEGDNIIMVSTILTVYVFMSLCMMWFTFIYAGIHTYFRTKTDRVSLEVGYHSRHLSDGAVMNYLPHTRLMCKLLEDIDIRKALAPFHYAFFMFRSAFWCFVLVYMKTWEITCLCILICTNSTYLLWMVYVRPFKTNLNNRIGIWVEACTLCCTLCIFPYIRGWETKFIFEDFARYQVSIL